MNNFHSSRWQSSLPGLCMLDHPLGARVWEADTSTSTMPNLRRRTTPRHIVHCPFPSLSLLPSRLELFLDRVCSGRSHRLSKHTGPVHTYGWNLFVKKKHWSIWLLSELHYEPRHVRQMFTSMFGCKYVHMHVYKFIYKYDPSHYLHTLWLSAGLYTCLHE